MKIEFDKLSEAEQAATKELLKTLETAIIKAIKEGVPFHVLFACLCLAKDETGKVMIEGLVKSFEIKTD